MSLVSYAVVEVEIKAKGNAIADKRFIVHNTCPGDRVTGGVKETIGGVRGDSVVVNGGRHSLDLVALIAYFKLKKRCQGPTIHQARQRER
ncbi:hypothetical protein GBAR_LOCUS9795 [Geodia barretti]|uniref:Uncharacterized protein n=1 Tax=Geodia barretti TaxID=519541 RepID=A0AA35RS75_GEOBA|nr:hypothetical protein GBAR_LOCUS9795 [Geodia barretti]